MLVREVLVRERKRGPTGRIQIGDVCRELVHEGRERWEEFNVPDDRHRMLTQCLCSERSSRQLT